MNLHRLCESCDYEVWIPDALTYDVLSACLLCGDDLHLELDSDIEALCAEWEAGYEAS